MHVKKRDILMWSCASWQWPTHVCCRTIRLELLSHPQLQPLEVQTHSTKVLNVLYGLIFCRWYKCVLSRIQWDIFVNSFSCNYSFVDFVPSLFFRPRPRSRSVFGWKWVFFVFVGCSFPRKRLKTERSEKEQTNLVRLRTKNLIATRCESIHLARVGVEEEQLQ